VGEDEGPAQLLVIVLDELRPVITEVALPLTAVVDLDGV
jgi:hypothetical protein